MITNEQLRDVVGATAYDSSGDKIGKVGNVYYDDDNEQPKWLTVHTACSAAARPSSDAGRRTHR